MKCTPASLQRSSRLWDRVQIPRNVSDIACVRRPSRPFCNVTSICAFIPPSLASPSMWLFCHCDGGPFCPSARRAGALSKSWPLTQLETQSHSSLRHILLNKGRKQTATRYRNFHQKQMLKRSGDLLRFHFSSSFFSPILPPSQHKWIIRAETFPHLLRLSRAAFVSASLHAGRLYRKNCYCCKYPICHFALALLMALSTSEVPALGKYMLI